MNYLEEIRRAFPNAYSLPPVQEESPDVKILNSYINSEESYILKIKVYENSDTDKMVKYDIILQDEVVYTKDSPVEDMKKDLLFIRGVAMGKVIKFANDYVSGEE